MSEEKRVIERRERGDKKERSKMNKEKREEERRKERGREELLGFQYRSNKIGDNRRANVREVVKFLNLNFCEKKKVKQPIKKKK